MGRYLKTGLFYLFVIFNLSNCFNDSSISLIATAVPVNQSDVPFVDLVVSVNESTVPLKVPEVSTGDPPKPLTNPGSALNGSHPLLQTSVFIVNMSGVPLVHTSVPVEISKGPFTAIGIPAHLKRNSTSIAHPGSSVLENLATESEQASSTDSLPVREQPLLSCDICMPPLKTGTDLYLGMAQWNSLVCGGSVCDRSLTEKSCASGSCDKCHCDPECIHYGDCCPDAFHRRAPQKAAAKLSCFSQQFIEAKKIFSKRYKMVSGCREGGNTFVTEACLNPDHMALQQNIPVYSKLTQLHYRNTHCAHCNGVEDGVSWDVKPFCEKYVDFSRVRSRAELLQKLRDEEVCAVHYIPPVTSPLRECTIEGDIVRTCNVTGNWVSAVYQTEIERACSLYSQTFTSSKGTNYNNIFCADCNGEELLSFDSCQHPITEPNAPFSLLLDVRSAAPEEMLRTDKMTCSADHVYDPNIDACRSFLCPEGSFPDNHQCTSVFKSAKGLGYIVHFTLTPKNRAFIVVRNSLHLFYDILGFLLGSLSMSRPQLNILNVNFTYVSHNGTNYVDVYSIDVQFAILVGTDAPIQEVAMSLNALLTRPFWWYESAVPNPVYFESTWLPDISSNRLKDSPLNHNKEDSGAYEVLTWKTIHSTGHHTKVPSLFLNNASAYIQISGLLMCTIIEINITEFFVNDSRTITVKYNGETLKEGEFLWNGDKVQVCTNFTGQKAASDSKSSRSFDKTEVSLTLVCTSLSLCGLAITLIIYFILPSLRTLPARNNIFLFINLFLAQLLFLTGSAAKVSPPVCRALAIIIHYFWLSTFCWKVVCAFHMYRLFTSPLKAIRYTKLLLKYILFTQITPCVIIALVVGINAAVSGMQRFGYAERSNLCFLSGTLDVALGFVTPVCLAVLINAMLFTRVVHVLRNRPKIRRHTSQSDVKESVLYFKMSLILGFTWILGFLALIINDKGLWYVFTVVNASIGIFVFLSFGLQNVSLSSLLHGCGNKDNLTNSNCKTFQTTDGIQKSNKNGKFSPAHFSCDSVCNTSVKHKETMDSSLP